MLCNTQQQMAVNTPAICYQPCFSQSSVFSGCRYFKVRFEFGAQAAAWNACKLQAIMKLTVLLESAQQISCCSQDIYWKCCALTVYFANIFRNPSKPHDFAPNYVETCARVLYWMCFSFGLKPTENFLAKIKEANSFFFLDDISRLITSLVLSLDFHSFMVLILNYLGTWWHWCNDVRWGKKQGFKQVNNSAWLSKPLCVEIQTNVRKTVRAPQW